MSDSTSSRNNLLHPECPPPATVQYVRDTEFYHDPNVVVLLVGNTLFRFRASLLAPGPGIEDYELKPYLKDALDPSGNTSNGLGISDERPIVLPKDVTIEAFRDLLRVSSGGVMNKQFMGILSGINGCFGCSPKLIDRLSKLGRLAGRFGMKRLDSWAQSKLDMIFQNWILELSERTSWNSAIILQLVQHMKMTSVADYRDRILRGTRLVMGALIVKSDECDLGDESKDRFGSTITRICTDLYKDKSLPTDAPCIFGFAYAFVLSLGHRSPVWVNDLSREDRRVLHASNSILTRLCDHAELGVGWLTKPTDMSHIINDCSVCSSSSNFNTWWDRGFGECKGLNSPIPLEDIRHL
ncbi:hypothetical protein FRC11_009771, partial [Ceratobasidium sp. 423]